MSRILLTWELGLNLGHLTRLLPVAQRLKAEGHTVLVATRDIQAATTVLGPAGIPFVQAPHLSAGIPLSHRPSGYADILLSQGWCDANILKGLTHAWLNLIRLFNPQRLIIDFSPTVSLAARIARCPTVLIGNGFELPPDTNPLPAFPGFSWATAEKAAESESTAVTHANMVLRAFNAQPISALRDLVSDQTRLLATFPELDHYGERSNVQFILSTLAEMKVRAICVANGFASMQLQQYKRDHIVFHPGPVDLQHLSDANLSITYGAEGTMMKFLLDGVPQLVSPWHVETYMAARRLEAGGVGRAITPSPTKESLLEGIAHLSDAPEIRQRLSLLRQKWLAVVGASVAAVFAASTAAAEDSPSTTPAECIQQPVAFDGRKPLSYAKVALGGQVPKAYLHAKYPEGCPASGTEADTRSPASCQSPTYVVQGDTVAIGKTCGDWAYVQYTGERHITTGWMRTADFGPTRTVSPRDDRLVVYGKEPVFALTRGGGTPVCEAYLQRLNQTQFEYPANCGRPEDDRVPGFHRLARVFLSKAEVEKNAALVAAITHPLTDIDDRYYDEMNANGGVFTGIPRPTILPNIDEVPRPGFLPKGNPYLTWRYAPAVDIDNDGSPDNVVIWDTDSAENPDCGSPNPQPTGEAQIALIMSADGSSVDQKRTVEIFGHPDGGNNTVSGTKGASGPIKFLKSFRPIGGAYGVFRYRDLYYFDTFYDWGSPVVDGDFEDKRKGSSRLPSTLAVFLRKGGKTTPACEYSVNE